MAEHNQLSIETSPYLRQHAENPVHWQAWGPHIFEQAQKEDKPILLSVGYAACHWCHVMARESFENPDIAKVMNDNFINVKVDREERPDIDHIYQNALALMREHGGWPLTMFLTPEGKPFWGGTYFPAEPRMGMPGFVEVLETIARTYQSGDEKIESNVAALEQGLHEINETRPGDTSFLDDGVMDNVAATIYRLTDTTYGGISGAPKFPNTQLIELLWRSGLNSGNQDYQHAVAISATMMAQGGIYDHVGGGFARYSVDQQWLVPHFEKMLYDNALLISFYTNLWAPTQAGLYAERIEATINWALREMRGPNINGAAAFTSSLNADSEGVEGKFYTWDEGAIDALLGAERAPFFKKIYDVHTKGNWEGVNILHRLNYPEPLDEPSEQQLRADLDTLFQARTYRIRPERDDKILADWNGLMIAALAHAGTMMRRHDWLDVAENAFAFITNHMVDNKHRLYHSWKDNQARHAGMLEDYTNMMLAAIRLYAAGRGDDYLNRVHRWANIVESGFKDTVQGAYYQTVSDSQDVILRAKPVNDAATPTGNGQIAHAFAEMAMIEPDGTWRQRMQDHLTALAGTIQNNILGPTSLLMAIDTWQKSRHITLYGAVDDPNFNALFDAFVANYIPDLAYAIRPSDDTAKGVYCAGGTCQPPVTDSETLADILATQAPVSRETTG